MLRAWHRATWWVTARGWARALYLLVAVALLGSYYGVDATSFPTAVTVSPWLYGFAAATCVVAAIDPDRPGAWGMSLGFTAVAIVWRVLVLAARLASAGAVDVVTLDLAELERRALLGLSIYTVLVPGVVAMWLLWLRPTRWVR